MTKCLRTAFIAVCFFVIPATALASDQVTVSDLIEMAEDLAGREVVVEGELVGDYGFRGDGWMWTQLNGDAYIHDPTREGGTPAGSNTGVGIRMPTDLGVGLDPPGGYRNRGPVVRVSGVWKYHDPERQGESYLDVNTMVMVEPGRRLQEGIDWTTTMVGLLLLATAAWVGRSRSKE